MKTRILAGIALSGALAASVAQAETNPSIESVEALYSGLSTMEVQRIHSASDQRMARKSICAWHEAAGEATEPATSTYLGKDKFIGEKDYLAAANQNFVC